MTQYVTLIRYEPSPYHKGWVQAVALDDCGQERVIGQQPAPDFPIGTKIQF